MSQEKKEEDPGARALWEEAHRSPLPGIRGAGEAYELLATSLAYPGGWVKVFRNRIRLPNGYVAEHEIAMPHDAVSIVPVIEERPGEAEVILVEQFRSTVEGYIHEIPAGLLNPGEEPAACALRELREETGFTADRVTPIASIHPTPGFALEKMHYFLAEGLRPASGQELDPGECLQVRRFPLRGLLDRLVLGIDVDGIPPIVDAKTWVGLLYVGLRRLAGAGAGKEKGKGKGKGGGPWR